MPAIIPLIPVAAAASAAAMYGVNKFQPDLVPQGLMIPAFVAAFAGSMVLIVAYRLFIYFPFLDPMRKLPQSRTFFPVVWLLKTTMARPLGDGFLEEIEGTPNQGLIYYPSMFTTDRLLVSNSKALADILVAKCYEFEKPRQAAEFLARILGLGLILSEGDLHKSHRKKIMPAFSFRSIRNLYPMMWRKSQLLVKLVYEREMKPQMKTPMSPAIVSIDNWSSRATLDIIGVAGLGHDFGSLVEKEDPIARAYERLLEPTREKVAYFFVNILIPHWIISMLPWKLNRELSDITGTLRGTSSSFVQRRRREIKDEIEGSSVDVISMMIKSNEFSDDQLVDHILTFLAAGHETTSATLEWLVYILAVHTDVQEKIREELFRNKEIIDRCDNELGEVLEKLPWLNGACQETLRLYPTVPSTIRVAVTDSVVAGQKVPKGTELILSPWTINRAPEMWGPDAAEWLPSRWIDFGEKPEDARTNNTGGASSNYSSLTFLHGPRSCIGQGFARAELRCLIAALILQYKWVLPSDIKQEIWASGAVTIKPVKGIKVLMEPLSPMEG